MSDVPEAEVDAAARAMHPPSWGDFRSAGCRCEEMARAALTAAYAIHQSVLEEQMAQVRRLAGATREGFVSRADLWDLVAVHPVVAALTKEVNDVRDDVHSDEGLDMPRPTTRWQAACRLRDWLHESPLNRCTAASDQCDTWDLAFDLADIALGIATPAPPPTQEGAE